MNVFCGYAHYYDLLYRDKDYAAEARFIHELLQKHAPGASTILDLGCGTAAHASELVALGYRVHGVDASGGMVARARDRRKLLSSGLAERMELSQGDIRSIRLNARFDAVISLFHVLSYQTTNEDLLAAFSTIVAHLKPGGLLVFDCWYGPGVLSSPPTVRVKRIEDDTISLTRIAEPELHLNDNVVDVNYHLFIRDKKTGSIEEAYELHKMRYLFKPELELLLNQFGFGLVEFREWMRDHPPEQDAWNACFAARLSSMSRG